MTKKPEPVEGPLAKRFSELLSSKGLQRKDLGNAASASLIQKICKQNYPSTPRKLGQIVEALKKEGVTVEYEELIQLRRQQIEEHSDTQLGKAMPVILTGGAQVGVYRVSIGSSRTEAFRQLTLKAQHRVVIMGIGMTNLSKYALGSLRKVATRVPIDFLMIDPVILKTEPKFAKRLEDFLGLPDFSTDAQKAFNILRDFCEKWNSQRRHRYKMRFRVYGTIPTLSMVMIDPKHERGEIELEFFLYHAGEFRPRLSVKKVSHDEGLFTLLNEKFDNLWTNSRIIV